MNSPPTGEAYEINALPSVRKALGLSFTRRMNEIVGRPDAVTGVCYYPKTDVAEVARAIGALFQEHANPFERAIPQLARLGADCTQILLSYPRIRIRWIDVTGLSENSLVLSFDVMPNSALIFQGQEEKRGKPKTLN